MEKELKNLQNKIQYYNLIILDAHRKINDARKNYSHYEWEFMKVNADLNRLKQKESFKEIHKVWSK